MGPLRTDSLSGGRPLTEVTWMGETSHVGSDFIKWPHQETSTLERSLPLEGSLKGWNIPSLKDRNLYLHVMRVKDTLEEWHDHAKNPISNPALLMRRCLTEGPSLAEELDDIIKYNMRDKLSSCCMYRDSWDVPMFPEVRGFGDFFHPAHLIPWAIEDPGDINLTFEEPPPVSIDLELYKAYAREVIKDGEKLPELDDVDRLETLGESKTFVVENQTTTSRTSGRLAQGLSLETTDQFLFKYCFVQKTTVDSRAAVITDFKTHNTMRLLKLSLEAVADCEEDCLPCKDFGWLKYWLSRSDSTYLMSDQKKCGITFPRQLLFALVEVLEEKYPNGPFGLLRKGYENSRILMPDGRWLRQTRGVNLGMVNEYVSLAVSVLFRMWSREESVACEGLFYNDDQVIRFSRNLVTNTQEKFEYGLLWDTFMEKAGMTVHKKKPFWSDQKGLFLEIYGTNHVGFKTEKYPQIVGNIFWSYLACSVGEAKAYISSLFENTEEIYKERMLKALSIVIRRIGFEFEPSEIHYSYPIGWVVQRDDEGRPTLASELSDSPLKHERLMQVIGASYAPTTTKNNSKEFEQFQKKNSWFCQELSKGGNPIKERASDSLSKVSLKSWEQIKAARKWSDLRKACYLRGKKSFKELMAIVLQKTQEMEPPEFIGRLGLKGQGSVENPELPSMTPLTLREAILAEQAFGKSADIVVRGDKNSAADKLLTAFTVSSEKSIEIGNLLLKNGTSKTKNFLDHLSFGGFSVPYEDIGNQNNWFPDYVPGVGLRLLKGKYLPWFRTQEDTFRQLGDCLSGEALVWACYACNRELAKVEDVLLHANFVQREVDLVVQELEDERESSYPRTLRRDSLQGDDPNLYRITQMMGGFFNKLQLEYDENYVPEESKEIAQTLFGTNEEDDFFGSESDEGGGLFGAFDEE
ncbi:putative RNA-dependent RNA polymerase [Downy mildew lesion associated ormycovirus 1]|uniref:RNA-dependent RNA polymerase n=1 Tax=Downy mildew lesion associated ormycovirus 1 TaxID=3162769 RepID=A0AAT9QFN4_9VIRU|nr:putative RNA-dependent RNA polymerase [Plasmopara viticola lesion-associated ormycovirus 1]